MTICKDVSLEIWALTPRMNKVSLDLKIPWLWKAHRIKMWITTFQSWRNTWEAIYSLQCTLSTGLKSTRPGPPWWSGGPDSALPMPRAVGSIPGQETKIPHAAQSGQNIFFFKLKKNLKHEWLQIFHSEESLCNIHTSVRMHHDREDPVRQKWSGFLGHSTCCP